MAADTKIVTFEAEIPLNIWQPFVALCEAQGIDPDVMLGDICTQGAAQVLDLLGCIEGGLTIDPGDVGACYDEAVGAVADWLCARSGCTLQEGRAQAEALLDGRHEE